MVKESLHDFPLQFTHIHTLCDFLVQPRFRAAGVSRRPAYQKYVRAPFYPAGLPEGLVLVGGEHFLIHSLLSNCTMIITMIITMRHHRHLLPHRDTIPHAVPFGLYLDISSALLAGGVSPCGLALRASLSFHLHDRCRGYRQQCQLSTGQHIRPSWRSARLMTDEES